MPLPPGTTPGPQIPIQVVDPENPPNTLPGYPGNPAQQGDGNDFTLYPNYETGHGYTTGMPPGVYAPGGAVGELLEEVRYTPFTTAKLGDPIPLPYGPCRVGGQIARAKRWLGELLVLVVWGEGGSGIRP